MKLCCAAHKRRIRCVLSHRAELSPSRRLCGTQDVAHPSKPMLRPSAGFNGIWCWAGKLHTVSRIVHESNSVLWGNQLQLQLWQSALTDKVDKVPCRRTSGSLCPHSGLSLAFLLEADLVQVHKRACICGPHTLVGSNAVCYMHGLS